MSPPGRIASFAAGLSFTLAAVAVASPRPEPRPAGYAVSAPGPVCGDPGLFGTRVAAIDGPGGCGIARPVRLERAAGVALEPPPVIACPTALALKAWLEESAKPAFTGAGPPLAGLDIAAGYVCRSVNGQSDAKLSEHARGRALDVMRFRLADGTVAPVETAWRGRPRGGLLRRIHAAACGIFGTTLGPDSDRHHDDHFHFDIADRRRPYCP